LPETFKDFIESRPSLKYLFFGGKGGVGKTVIAAGAACYLAKMGKKTLISSTNPVHSLSSLCDQDFWGRSICKVEGVDNLYAIEIDISDTVQRYKTGVRDKVLTFLKSADIPLNPEPFIEVATTNPAFEEAAMFEDMIGLILTGDFDI